MSDFWKDKKILAYIALAHHTRFITPVMEALKSQGASVTYVIGQAERSQEITAINLGLDYTHVFDWLSEADRNDIQDNYKRLHRTLSRSLNTSFLYSATPITVIDKTIRATAMEYVGFRNLIDQMRPDICFALHELNRWGKMFSFWAKKKNIPVLTFQEGLYYGNSFAYTGHLQHSTFNLIWGKRVKEKLMGYEAPGDRILEVGNTHLADEIRLQKSQRMRQRKRKEHRCQDKLAVLLIFSGEIPSFNQFTPLFNSLKTSEKAKLFIKFHPSARQEQVDRWISRIPEDCRRFISTFTGNENLYNLLSMSDVVALAQASTTGLEALFFQKPLILLDIKMSRTHPYSFIDFKVATKMTPGAFGKAILDNTDFTTLTEKKDIDAYLKNELSETTASIEKVVKISQTLITAGHLTHLPELVSSPNEQKIWSIIIQLPRGPEEIIRQLEAIALHSEQSGDFEVILIEPENISDESVRVLDTLKGDLIRIKTPTDHSLPQMMNRAVKDASGKIAVFLPRNMLPGPGWLKELNLGIQKYPGNRIFGARISDNRGSIIHAGIIIDKNNTPVSAYTNLPADHPNVLKERPFQMINLAMAMNRNAFCQMGGFSETSGRYSIMDLCMRANMENKRESACIYLPKLCLTSFEPPAPEDTDGALHFYGKWHGSLWQNQDDFYKNDQITKEELDTARLTWSMATA